jgi:hypothetical protein
MEDSTQDVTTGRPIIRSADAKQLRADNKSVRKKRRGPKPLPRGPPPEQALCFTIPEFCKLHRISVAHYFVLKRNSLTPTEMKLGGRHVISVEEATRWRAERTAAAEAA